MGIVDTIVRSKDDLVKPNKKSYAGYLLDVTLVDISKIQEKVTILPAEQRALDHELSGKEPIQKIIILKNSHKSLGRLTTNQMKDILDDMGFNVDTIFSSLHYADTAAVMNINGFVIPGWIYFAKLLIKLNPSWEKLVLTKLAPGRERLHIRVFEMNDGNWLIAAHTDWNWMSLNLKKVIHSHIEQGTGNYAIGTRMMVALLNTFKDRLEQNKILSYKDILNITRWAYFQEMADQMLLLLYGNSKKR